MVDDDEDTRQLIAFALGENDRYAVTEAADGEAALAALRAGRFDLVITDYDMPGLTGAEMLKRATRDGTSSGKRPRWSSPRIPTPAACPRKLRC